MSQEQLDQVKQQMPEVGDDAATPSIEVEAVEEPEASSASDAVEPAKATAGNELAATTATTQKRRVKKKLAPVDEKAISPRPSYWPLLLAFSLAVVLAGAISNLIVLGIGVLLVVVSIVGWSLERR